MNTNLIPFKFKDTDVRVITDEAGEPWFVAKDVAEVLGYVNTSKAISTHCKSLKMLKSTDSVLLNIPSRGLQIIPERDVYRLIIRSKLPSAEQFEEWVVGEVLPSIRKTGKYEHSVHDIPETYSDALRALADKCDEEIAQREARVAAEKKLAIAAPKAEFCDQVSVAPDAITVSEAAKVLDTGRNRLMSSLRTMGWISRRNEPYQERIESGLMDVKLGRFHDPKQGLRESITPLITGKGLVVLQSIFAELEVAS